MKSWRTPDVIDGSMSRGLSIVLLLATLAAGVDAKAQVSHDPQIWTAVLGTAKLSDTDTGPSLWLDMHLRRSGGGTLHIFRPAVGWRHDDWLSFWAGYAWVPVLPDEADAVHEHRPWQQVIVKNGGTAPVSLQARTRFEQRVTTGGNDVGFRLREFLRVSWSWRDDKAFGLVGWDELFVGLNETDWGAPTGLDQNRFFAGGYALAGPNLRVELGYLSLFLDRDEDIIGHVLAANVFVSI